MGLGGSRGDGPFRSLVEGHDDTAAPGFPEAADRQQAAINASLEQSDNYSKQAESKALENATQYDATDRLKKFDETKAAAGESLAQQLTKSRKMRRKHLRRLAG